MFVGAIVAISIGIATSGLLFTHAVGDRPIRSPRTLETGDLQAKQQANDAAGQPRTSVPAHQVTSVSIVEKFLEALSQGDTAKAMEFVAEGAVFQSGLQPFVVGALAIGASVGALVEARAEIRLLSAEVGGSTVRSLLSVSSDDVRLAGFDRVVWAVNWRVSDGQIACAVSAYDMSDAETRRYVVLLTSDDGSIGP